MSSSLILFIVWCYGLIMNISISDEIARHITLIKVRCRICGKVAEKQRNKSVFEKEIKELFKTDITLDDKEIHPNLICNNHATLLYRYRKAEEKSTFQSNCPIANFMKHDDQCKVCNVTFLKRNVNLTNLDQANDDPCKRVKTDANPSNPAEDAHDYQEVLDESQPFEKVLSLMEKVPDKAQFLTDIIEKIDQQDKVKLAKLLGLADRKMFSTSMKASHGVYKDLDALNSFSSEKHIESVKDTMMLNFLVGLIGSEPTGADEFRFGIVLEIIFGLQSSMPYIGPLSFLQNINVYALTNSKLAANICGSLVPGGRYNTLSTWLSLQGGSELKCPDGDIVAMFDNEQILMRSWNIKPNNTFKSSVITNISAVALDPDSTLQKEKVYHPKSWFKVKGNENVVHDMTMSNSEMTGIDDSNNALLHEHFNQVHDFLEAAIEEVVSEQKLQADGSYCDVFDAKVKATEGGKKGRKCPHCGSENPPRKQKCVNENCRKALSAKPGEENIDIDQIISCPTHQRKGAKVDNNTTAIEFDLTQNINFKKPRKQNIKIASSERYENIPSNHDGQKRETQMLDPVFVNPNNYQCLKLVLRHLGKKAGVARYGGTQRQWLTVSCDGLPYSLVLELILNFKTCGLCNKSFMAEEFDVHCSNDHRGQEEVPFFREFDWVNLKVGEGHRELNLMKAFVELNWEICFKELAQLMGWQSENALQNAKKCTDTHKTWQMILVFYIGTLEELLVNYVRISLSKNEEPSVKGFLSWAKKCEDPNYGFMFEDVLRYAQGIINFRMGIRRNNHMLIRSAIFVTKELFHGRNHPRYQELELWDTFRDLVMPKKLLEFSNKYMSISKSGNRSTGQGFDFLLEEDNREIKKWIKRVLPTDKVWTTAVRNKTKLEHMKERLVDKLGVKTLSHESRSTFDLTEAIAEWRLHLRKTGYLSTNEVLHKSISGEMLDPGLQMFTQEAQRKRNYRILKLLLKQDLPDDPSISHPVYITPTENEHKNSLQNQTVKTLGGMILDLIQQLREDQRDHYFERFKREVLDKKKEKHINFYLEILGVFTEDVANRFVIETEVEFSTNE